ncbi:MAG: dihydrolipoyl dehydrogenase [Candidatus Cloacimonadaceae bacterium]|nr:dihydrolipoyl dehydrogenase [Candidatus Cloacimonadaceae bacterium]
MEHFQVAVIGGGPGGYEAAIRLNQYGISCAVFEKERIGGVCLNWGCIPTKTLVKSAELVRETQEAESFGLNPQTNIFSYQNIFARKNKIVEQLVSGIEFLFRKRKIPIINEMVVSVAAGEQGYVLQTDKANSFTAEYIIVATGSDAKSLPGIEIDETEVLSSTGILKMDTLPKSLAVIGGGVIGCEFASIYSTFGVEVHIIEFLPKLVSTEDEEISKRLAMALKKSGIKVKLNTAVTSIEKTAAGLNLKLSDDTELQVEKALLSVGRVPVNNIAWQNLDMATQRGSIEINDLMQTTLPRVYAIGDVTGKMLLAHTASKQGLIAVEHIRSTIENTKWHHAALEYIFIPRCTFTEPEIASVGYTEEQAKATFGEILIGKFPFAASGKAMAMGNTFGFVKTIARADTQQLIGMHIIGPQAAELIAQGGILISLEAKADDVERIVFAHPTLSESIKESLEDIRNLSIHKI